MSGLVLAAGAGVWRRGPSGVEVLLVHRPRYDDWSLPKGKLDPGESWEAGARREVEEETGLRCRVRREVAETRYRDRKGRDKRVRYWLMEPVDGEFRPNGEVDAVRWLTVDDAVEALTYRHDADLLGRLPDSL